MVKDLILLSADTSSSRFSIALLKGHKLIDEFESGPFNRHSSGLLPEIERLLSKNSYILEDIDALCVGLGPGSFTGLRVGLTTVRGMALALRKPIVGIPSIDGLAYSLLWQKDKLAPSPLPSPQRGEGIIGIPCRKICPIIDAKQNRVYARIYSCSNKNIKPRGKFLLLGIKELLSKISQPTTFLGDGIRLYKNDILQELGQMARFAPESLWYPKAAIIGMLGLERLRAGKRDDVFSLSPLYIYHKECQIRKNLVTHT